MSYHILPPDPGQGNRITHIIRESDGACIPIDERNQDFQEFQRWNAEQDDPIELEGEE